LDNINEDSNDDLNLSDLPEKNKTYEVKAKKSVSINRISTNSFAADKIYNTSGPNTRNKSETVMFRRSFETECSNMKKVNK
jgi:predicted patatin/cPLA2 family phospholipase